MVLINYYIDRIKRKGSKGGRGGREKEKKRKREEENMREDEKPVSTGV